MTFFKRKLSPAFNAPQQSLSAYSIVLVKQDAATAEAFATRLSRWLLLQGDGQAGRAEKPATSGSQVTINCTEAVMASIERQFAGDILKTLPPPEHIRGTVYPPKVDPWDVSLWSRK